MKEAIYKLVADLKAVSFVNLCREIEGFSGGLAMVDKNPHIVFWIGVSSEGVRAINELRAEGRIEMKPTQALTYLVDGEMLNLPQVTKVYNYKKDHWLPVIFDVPKPQSKSKRK